MEQIKFFIKIFGLGLGQKYLGCIEENAMESEQIFLSLSGPSEGWNKTFGGINNDVAKSVVKTSDNCYVILGETNSYGNTDIWLLKTDMLGNELWNKTFGEFKNEKAMSIVETQDKGLIFIGYTTSIETDDKNVIVIKTDNDGNQLWSKTFGGSKDEWGWDIEETFDGGFILTGQTMSYGAGFFDAWLIRIDSLGNELWNKTYGGVDGDYGQSIDQTSDLGYIITGETFSYGAGDGDVQLIKTDCNGTLLWSKTYGGRLKDFGTTVLQLEDKGYLIVGGTYNYGMGECDIWVIKTDEHGNKIWDKTFGGYKTEWAWNCIKSIDRGFFLIGFTDSYQSKNDDMIIIKIDEQGNLLWEKIIGGLSKDWGWSACTTDEQNLIVVGETASFGKGNSDMWLIKIIDGNNCPEKPTIKGPPSGKIGINYEYNCLSYDNDNDEIFYLIDWGDGTDSGWIGPYESGENCSASHVWNDRGNYKIKVIAKDVYGAESEWSDPLAISMAKKNSYNNPIIQLILKMLKWFPLPQSLLIS